jgi:sugar phosphate isomerase/epimerase
MDRIGIEQLTVFGLPPVQFVELAADLDCRYISITLSPPPYNPHNYPEWSLRDDPNLRREMVAAMNDRGVTISLGEGLVVLPNADIRERARDLEIMRELGVTRINTTSFETDLGRTLDQYAQLAEMAERVGLDTVMEFSPRPGSVMPTPAAAFAAIRHIGRRSFRLLVDTMHFVRAGGSAADLRALDPDMIGYAQICDAPLVSKAASYMEEAMYDRMVPGEGELPLVEILAALPRQLVVGIEVPLRSQAEAGVGTRERVRRCVEATRLLLEQAERATPGSPAH